MLPHPRQVGEPQIDHLDLLVLDRLHEIFGCRAFRNHGFAPLMESRVLEIVLPRKARLSGLRRFPLHVLRRCRTDMAALAFAQPVTREPASFSSRAAHAS